MTSTLDCDEAIELTPPQARFAAHQSANPAFASPNGSGIFFYRAQPDVTERWLVSAEGAVVEFVLFRHNDRD